MRAPTPNAGGPSHLAMNATLPEAALAFLTELSFNNNKVWFQAHRARYERDLKRPVRALVAAVNDELMTISPRHVTAPNRALSRINRDLRFGKDKTPYNTHVWAGWHPEGVEKGASAGFYFGFTPDSLGVGAGMWAPGKERLAKLRQQFADHHDEWSALLGADGFDYEVGSKAALKRVPKPWPQDHSAGRWLKMKGVHVKADLDCELLTSEHLVDHLCDHFRHLNPLVKWLNRGLSI